MKKEKIILASFRAESLAKLLNGERDLDIRKMFPHNFHGWVYAYLTRTQGHNALFKFISSDGKKAIYKTGTSKDDRADLNGKIICRFYVYKTEEIYMPICKTSTLSREELCKRSGMDEQAIDSYLTSTSANGIPNAYSGKAAYISKLDVFAEPLELNDFILCATNKAPKTGPFEIAYVIPNFEPKYKLFDNVYIKRDGKTYKCVVQDILGSKHNYRYQLQTVDAPWKAGHFSEESIYKTLADVPTAKQEIRAAINTFNDLIVSEKYLELTAGALVAKILDIQNAARALEPRKDIKIFLVNHKDTEE